MRRASLPFSVDRFPFCPIITRLAACFARDYDAADGEPEVVSAMPEARLPRTSEEIAAAARERGLSIPAPCLKGVAANLELLSRHAERLRGAHEAGAT